MRVESVTGGGRLAKPYLDRLTAKARTRKGYLAKCRVDAAGAMTRKRGCDVHGCGKTPTRFIGSKRTGWLAFCSGHRDEAYTINGYLHSHHIY